MSENEDLAKSVLAIRDKPTMAQPDTPTQEAVRYQLRELIREQSEGEWDDAMIRKDADTFTLALFAPDSPIGKLLAAKDAEIAKRFTDTGADKAELWDHFKDVTEANGFESLTDAIVVATKAARYREALEPFAALCGQGPNKVWDEDRPHWTARDHEWGRRVTVSMIRAARTAISDNGGGA
jgi:hypothetical protein